MKKAMLFLLVFAVLFIFSFNAYAQGHYCQRYQLFETQQKYNDEHKIFLIDTQTGEVWYLFISGGRYFWEPTKTIKNIKNTEKK